MIRKQWIRVNLLWVLHMIGGALPAAVPPPQSPELHYVANAHLDTEWRWDVRETIRLHLPATLRENFSRFETFPHYLFNFDGAIRYQMMKAYYPELYETMKGYVESGRWHISGPGLDVLDVNLPDPESVIRNILLAQTFYEREFDRRALDAFLPDCFGFNYAFPTLARHCGLVGFSTQKLGWGSAVGIPFWLGFWRGVDGSVLPSAFHSNPYDSMIRSNSAQSQAMYDALKQQGAAWGLPVAYRYYGVGDQGGAPDVASLHWLGGMIADTNPLVRVVSARSDQIFEYMAHESVKTNALYDGELLLTKHGVGGYTSKAVIKRWNRECERLARAAEQSAAAVSMLFGEAYPADVLRDAWIRFLWHQHHDGITGTSWESTNEILLNDFQIARNQFVGVLKTAVAQWGRRLSSHVQGHPLVVYNSRGFDRTDIVDVTIPLDRIRAPSIRVYDQMGKECVVQEVNRGASSRRIIFAGRVPASGIAVYDLRGSDHPPLTAVEVEDRQIANTHYRVEVNPQEQISSIMDLQQEVELLADPIRFDLLDNHPHQWPEWEIEYDQLMAAPRVYPESFRGMTLNKGPVRSTVNLVHEFGDSVFSQDVHLYHVGPKERIEAQLMVHWHSTGTLAKLAFPLTLGNTQARYDLGVGSVERPVNTSALYEVPAQDWAHVSDESQGRGVAVLSASAYGWDFPATNTLRMTLLHSPRNVIRDMGRHVFNFALYSHSGDWTSGVQQQAAALDHPLQAVLLASPGQDEHPASNHLYRLSGGAVQVLAVKRSEDGQFFIFRLVEASGKPGSTQLRIAAKIQEAVVMNGLEDVLDELTVSEHTLDLDFEPYQIRTVGLTVRPPVRDAESNPNALPLVFDADIAEEPRRDGAEGDHPHTFSADLWPQAVRSVGVDHRLGPARGGALNALRCRGQALPLDRQENDVGVSLLLASMNGDRHVSVSVHGKTYPFDVPDFADLIAAWDPKPPAALDDAWLMSQPPYRKKGQIAWVGNHAVSTSGLRVPHTPTSLYQVVIPLEQGDTELLLPKSQGLYLVAATRIQEDSPLAMYVSSADPLLDISTLEAEVSPSRDFAGEAEVVLTPGNENSTIHYTLDGSRPTAESLEYTGPVRLTESATLRAMSIDTNKPYAYEIRVPLRAHEFVRATAVSSVRSGLQYTLYREARDMVPEDFSVFNGVETGVVSGVVLPETAVGDHFLLEYRGLLHIPKTGVYTFLLSSDDGSILELNGEEVINHDGIHGMQIKTGKQALESGYHRLSVRYFEASGAEGLNLSVLLDGKEIRDDLWFHEVPNWRDRLKRIIRR